MNRAGVSRWRPADDPPEVVHEVGLICIPESEGEIGVATFPSSMRAAASLMRYSRIIHLGPTPTHVRKTRWRDRGLLPIHGNVAMVAFVALPAAAWLLSGRVAALAERSPAIRLLRPLAILCAAALVAFFVCLAPVFANRPPYALGLVERVLIVLYCGWLVAAGVSVTGCQGRSRMASACQQTSDESRELLSRYLVQAPVEGDFRAACDEQIGRMFAHKRGEHDDH